MARSILRTRRASGPSSLKQYCLPGGASRLAALLLPQILAVFSVVAPCHPGAALRNPVLLQRGQATSLQSLQHQPQASSSFAYFARSVFGPTLNLTTNFTSSASSSTLRIVPTPNCG